MVVLVGGWAYFRYLRYERVAARHLPPDTTAAVRIDVEQVVFFAPVREHLVPLVDELGRTPAGAALEPRLQRLERETGLKLALELRELIVARGPTWSDWVMVIGGRFPKRGVVEGIERVLSAEGVRTTLSPDGRTLVFAGGQALGQAQDGVLVLAASAARLSRALPASETYARLRLAPDGGGSFASEGAVVQALAASPAALVSPSLRSLGAVEHVAGTLTLGSIVEVDVDLDLYAGTDASRFREDLKSLLASFSSLGFLLPVGDYAGERAALAKADVQVAGPNRVHVRLPWPRQDVERGAAALAAAIRASMGASAR
jgi:hypothetical protein